MLFNIPQFIDKEDKIVGPLTAKQLGWLAGGGAVLLVLWNVLDKSAFYIAAIFVGAIAGALAFYHPNGQPLISFVFSSFAFMTRPKVYLWKRVPEKEAKKTIKKKKNDIIKVHKEVTSAKIEGLADLLDSKQKTQK